MPERFISIIQVIKLCSFAMFSKYLLSMVLDFQNEINISIPNYFGDLQK